MFKEALRGIRHMNGGEHAMFTTEKVALQQLWESLIWLVYAYNPWIKEKLRIRIKNQ